MLVGSCTMQSRCYLQRTVAYNSLWLFSLLKQVIFRTKLLLTVLLLKLNKDWSIFSIIFKLLVKHRKRSGCKLRLQSQMTRVGILAQPPIHCVISGNSLTFPYLSLCTWKMGPWLVITSQIIITITMCSEVLMIAGGTS